MPKIRKFESQDNRFEEWMFFCPGCQHHHAFRTVAPATTDNGIRIPTWRFDGDVENPTFSPSLRVFDPHSWDKDKKEFTRTRCHLTLERGVLNFCSDSAHRLAGLSMPCPDLDTME